MTIGDRGRAYRRGVVLGLTMAEIMLLLVFCLLIAISVTQLRTRTEQAQEVAALADEALRAERLEQLLRETIGEAALAERMQAAEAAAAGAPAALRPGGPPIEDGWRRLLSEAGLVARLRQAGIDLDGLVEATAGAPLAGAPDAASAFAAERIARVAAEEEAAALRTALDRAEATIAARAGRPTDLPPIITLREDRGFHFETGRARPSDAFADRIRGETVEALTRLIAAYDVDVIEVIGHTDERPMGGGLVSSLDGDLLTAVRGGRIGELMPADNAGLGLARAVEVARLLKADPRLAGIEVLPLSAGQLVGTDGRLTAGGGADDPARRRIEIRLRRALAPDAPAP